MKGYVVCVYKNITNEEKLKEYAVKARAAVEKYKGKFEYLQRIIGKNAKVILEIGGHYGEDTLRFYKYFPHSKIYSFEPDPRNIQIFKKICSNIPSIQLIEKAVSDKHNDSILFYMAYSDMIGKLQDKYNFITISVVKFIII